MKEISIIKKLNNVFPRHLLITIYKYVAKLRLNYGDVVYDEQSNDNFCQHIASIQNNASLAVIDVIKGTSKFNSYNNIGLDCLNFRWCLRKLFTFYKMKIIQVFLQQSNTGFILFQKVVTCAILVHWKMCQYLTIRLTPLNIAFSDF